MKSHVIVTLVQELHSGIYCSFETMAFQELNFGMGWSMELGIDLLEFWELLA